MTKYILLFSYTIVLVLDYLIKNNYFGSTIKSFYIKKQTHRYSLVYFFVFCFVFTILIILGLFDIHLPNMLDDLLKNLDLLNSSGSQLKIKILDGVTLTLQSLQISVFISINSLSNLIFAGTSSVGATIGYKITQEIPGGLLLKVVGGVAAMVCVQIVTAGMSKALQTISKDSNNNNGNNFINNILDGSEHVEKMNQKFPEYPLNLLPEISRLVDIEVLMVIILNNIFLVNFLTKVDFSKYLPKNRLGNLILWFINRYINIWSKISKFFIVFCWILLLYSVALLKFLTFLIFSHPGA